MAARLGYGRTVGGSPHERDTTQAIRARVADRVAAMMVRAPERRAPPAGETAPLTVAAALRLECLAAGSPEVVAGERGLDRAIRWSHVGEVPNLASLLRGGELVLTTGTALGPDERALERFVAELGERRIAGLVIELGARFKTVPRVLAEAAHKTSLPLIALHREISFVEVTEAINDELHERELGRARRAERLQQEMVMLLLDGGGIPEVLAALAATIRNPVVLERDDGELIYHATAGGDSGAALAAWEGLRGELPGAPDHLAVPVPSGRTGTRGRLLAIALDGELDDFAPAALDRAAALIGIATRQTRQEQALAARARGNLLMSLIESELSEAEIVRQVTAMSFPQRVPYLLPCGFAAASGLFPAAQDEGTWSAVWTDVRRELDGQAIPVIGGLTPRGRQIALVLGLASPAQRESRAEGLARLFAAALRRAVGSGDAGSLSVGAASRSWTGVIAGLREVMEATELPRTPSRLWYDATRPDLDRLLWSLRGSDELRRFVQRRLGPLIEHDAQRATKLLPTLEAYLKCDGHKTETARLLQLERQSVYHRISRIESLLDDSLDDEATRLGVHLAMRARHLVGDPDERRP